MQKLVNGIHQFQNSIFGKKRELFEQLIQGQRPLALFVTCSDSRVNTSVITQTDPGDLFVLRNAGNIVPPYGAVHGSEAGTVEFALSALGVRDIVVCGHSGCGAMKGLLDPESVRGMPAVERWLSHAEATARIMRENYAGLDGEARLTATVQENVLVQVENLKTHPAVAARLARGELRLHGWVYKIATGEIFCYDTAAAQFVALPEDSADLRPTGKTEDLSRTVA